MAVACAPQNTRPPVLCKKPPLRVICRKAGTGPRGPECNAPRLSLRRPHTHVRQKPYLALAAAVYTRRKTPRPGVVRGASGNNQYAGPFPPRRSAVGTKGFQKSRTYNAERVAGRPPGPAGISRYPVVWRAKRSQSHNRQVRSPRSNQSAAPARRRTGHGAKSSYHKYRRAAPFGRDPATQ